MKNPLTPVGIEAATFRIIAQHLNHCATAVPELKQDMVLMFAWDAYGNQIGQNVTLWWEENG
jgi:hypothetical protein